jgi:sec-independent protein translocase protein TatA
MLENLFKPMHLLVIFFIIVLIYGPKKLGDLGKGLGEGIRNFKSSMHEGNSTNSAGSTTTTTTATATPPPAATPTATVTEEKK